jgi:hypothetical protein
VTAMRDIGSRWGAQHQPAWIWILPSRPAFTPDRGCRLGPYLVGCASPVQASIAHAHGTTAH